MLKHSECLSTLDQELFPGIREEKDTKRWLLRKWAFAMMLGAALVYWFGPLWQTGGQQVKAIVGKTSLQDAAQDRSIVQTTQPSWLGGLKTSVSRNARASMVIPKGTLIPVEIEATQLGGLGQTVIRARTKSYVFPDKTVMIPAGSEVEGTAQRFGRKWEIRWDSVSVLSAEGRRADLEAMNEVPGTAGLYGKSLLVKAK
ncbi:MAG: hypothetical protein EPN47_09480 [Acidobacteria bacterium]|nr:MAG: hypothetical protein EPN47_09480 [Acidobacteriota bacterium]